jgi:MoxR-like ATPase
MNLTAIKITLLKTHNIRTTGMSDTEIKDLAVKHGLLNIDRSPREDEQPQDEQPQPQPQLKEKAPMNDNKALAEQIANLISNAAPKAPEMDENRIIELIKANTQERPREVVVTPYNAPDKAVNVGVTHEIFDEALHWLSMGSDLFFSGATGTGKSTTAKQIAQALSMNFFSMGSIMTKFETLGSMLPDVGFIESVVYKWLNAKDGGVLCIDEIDASNPNGLTSIMPIFDFDGEVTFLNGETLKRTDKHHIIITGNTDGAGANAEYNSRLKLDDAFRSRFVFMRHDYNKAVEDSIGGKDLADYARKFRNTLTEKRIKGAIVTPRTIKDAHKAINNDNVPKSLRKKMVERVFKQAMKDNDYKALINSIGEYQF